MLFNDLKLRARALFKPGKVEHELADELAFHIACETQKLVAGGLSAAEARQRALARFGSLPLAADQCRDQRRIAFFETLTRDIGFAMRTFRRAPLVALTVVSTIALGLGVAAVAFTFFNAFFFQVDAVRHPDELFSVVRLERPGSRRQRRRESSPESVFPWACGHWLGPSSLLHDSCLGDSMQPGRRPDAADFGTVHRLERP